MFKLVLHLLIESFLFIDFTLKSSIANAVQLKFSFSKFQTGSSAGSRCVINLVAPFESPLTFAHFPQPSSRCYCCIVSVLQSPQQL